MAECIHWWYFKELSYVELQEHQNKGQPIVILAHTWSVMWKLKLIHIVLLNTGALKKYMARYQ